MHNESWKVGDEATSLLAILQTDHAQGKMEEWDVLNTIQQLTMSKIIFFIFRKIYAKLNSSCGRHNSRRSFWNHDHSRSISGSARKIVQNSREPEFPRGRVQRLPLSSSCDLRVLQILSGDLQESGAQYHGKNGDYGRNV